MWNTVRTQSYDSMYRKHSTFAMYSFLGLIVYTIQWYRDTLSPEQSTIDIPIIFYNSSVQESLFNNNLIIVDKNIFLISLVGWIRIGWEWGGIFWHKRGGASLNMRITTFLDCIWVYMYLICWFYREIYSWGKKLRFF